jgi:hypothetical protein
MAREPVGPIDTIGCAPGRIIPGLLFERLARDGDRGCIAALRNKVWTNMTRRRVSQRVRQLRAALDLLPNEMQRIAFDFAAMAKGLITVPVNMHDGLRKACSIRYSTGARLQLRDGPMAPQHRRINEDCFPRPSPQMYPRGLTRQGRK